MARVARFEPHGSGHFMIRGAATWTALTTSFVAGAVGAREVHPTIAGAFDAPVPDGLRLSLRKGAL